MHNTATQHTTLNRVFNSLETCSAEPVSDNSQERGVRGLRFKTSVLRSRAMAEQKKFWFRSHENATSRFGENVIEAWRKIECDALNNVPLPSWLHTDSILAYDQYGEFIRVGTYAQWCESRVAADAAEDSETECETCQGTGIVEVREKHYLDRGTRWQRSDEQSFNEECPSCNGIGRINVDEQVRLQIAREDGRGY